VCSPSGEVHPLEWCDFRLYEHGENGRPPTDHSFNFKAGTAGTSPKEIKAQYRSNNNFMFFEQGE
jgi:hypothetical protein